VNIGFCKFVCRYAKGGFALVTFLLALTFVSLNSPLAEPFSKSAAISSVAVENLTNSANSFHAGLPSAKVELKLPTKSGYVQSYFEAHDIRAKNYKAQFSKKNRVIVDSTRVDLFKGTTSGASEDFARLAIIHNTNGSRRFSGLLRTKGTFYRLTSADATNPELEVKEISTAELQQLVAACGIEGSAKMHGDILSPELERDINATALKQAQIATDADFEFFQTLGSSANATILSILNAVDGIYQSELGLTFSVTFQNVWTTASDPYSSSNSSTLLGQFRTYWQNNFSNNKTYDLAHLWTGRDIEGSVVGIAYLGVVCSPGRYGLSQYMNTSSLDIPLAAHEIGHNFDAEHDSCSGSDPKFLMCPFLVPNMNRFSATSKSAIAAHVSSISCLSPVNSTPENSAPVLANIGAKSVAEGATLSFSVSATDADGHAISYSATNLPSGASFVGTTFSYSPSLNVVTDGNSQRQFTVTFAATDSQGASDSEAIVLTVLNTNQSPVLSNPSTQSLSEGQIFTFQLSATDPDSDSINYSFTTALPPGATLSSSGLFSWKPFGNQAGFYSVGVKVSDPYGGEDTSTLNLNVANVPSVPNLPTEHVKGDLNGDSAAELMLFRNSNGTWIHGTFDYSGVSITEFGLAGDIPIVNDFNGDRISDIALFRPSNSTWYIKYSGSGATLSFTFGMSTDIPTSGDFNGDGRADIAIYRPAQAYFIYLDSSDNRTHIASTVGGAAAVPVPCDYDGDGSDDLATFAPTSGIWTIAKSTGGTSSSNYGINGDIAVPADYNSDGQCDVAVWRPSTGQWFISPDNSSSLIVGGGADIPVPGDYLGNGIPQLATYNPSTGNWNVRRSGGNVASQQMGLSSDLVALAESYYYGLRKRNAKATQALNGNSSVALFRRQRRTLYSMNLSTISSLRVTAAKGSYLVRGDYDGDSANDTAVFNKGTWNIYTANGGITTLSWGENNDIPVAGDFDGDGRTDVAIFRPNNGTGNSSWYVIKSTDGTASIYNLGLPGDLPLTADFNGDGWSDPAVWRPSSGVWYVMNARSSQLIDSLHWGIASDIPLVGDFDNDGKADKALFRESSGQWLIYYSGGNSIGVAFGQRGDIPIVGNFLSGTNADLAVYRPRRKTLFVRSMTGHQGNKKFNVKLNAKETLQAVALTPNSRLK